MLDRALAQVIKHLIARDAPWARDRDRFVELVAIEVTEAVRADLSGLHQLLERRDRVGERV